MFTIERGNQWNQAQTHTVQESGSPEHRNTASSNANKFNLAIDEENMDFNISGVPNVMVKRSHGINVYNLIQQIEKHPQRRALQSDLQQHRPFNLFSRESKDAITAAGNTKLCEILDVEPKAQCKVCLAYWDAGIVYCTCGHFLRDDTTENKKYISSVLDLFSFPNFYIRKGRPHGQRYGQKEGCKEFHTAKQFQKRCQKKQYENIHDRFIRDTWFRKTMIELGRSERVIFEMDILASEDHSHIATQEEIDVYRGNWWIRSNVVNFDTMPTRRQPDFKKALSTLYRLKKAEDKTHYENWSQSSSSWWRLNGSRRIRAKPKLHKKPREPCKGSWKPRGKPKVIYTDNALEFGEACEDLSWNHCTSTPHRSETDGIAERAVRRVKEGSSAVLLQSGLHESWWTDSMELYTYLRNVTDLLSDGKTPYERRFVWRVHLQLPKITTKMAT